MRKLKNKEHTLYEVWNEYHAESIFVDHKPTKAELIEICNLQQWTSPSHQPDVSEIVKTLKVEHLQPIYTK